MSEVKSMITKDQLEKIQGFQKELNKLLNEVGFLEAQKAQVLGNSVKKTKKPRISKKN